MNQVSTQQKCLWYGQSGRAYEYVVYKFTDIGWKDLPGNYVMARGVNGVWVAVYIGHAVSLRDRLCDRHHKWRLALAHGATHIHAHLNLGGEGARVLEEADLLGGHLTPCNELLN